MVTKLFLNCAKCSVNPAAQFKEVLQTSNDFKDLVKFKCANCWQSEHRARGKKSPSTKELNVCRWFLNGSSILLVNWMTLVMTNFVFLFSNQYHPLKQVYFHSNVMILIYDTCIGLGNFYHHHKHHLNHHHHNSLSNMIC